MADDNKSTTPGKVSVCKICGKLFAKPQLLAAHKRIAHPGAPPQGHATKPKGIYNKGVKCPECGKTFLRATGLGSHRLKAHGIAGKSKTTLYAARRNKLSPGGAARGKLKCPECGMRFVHANTLGRHRQRDHGIPGSSQAVLWRNKKLKQQGVISPNGYSPSPSHDQETQISEFALGHTLASIQSLIANICLREAIPTDIFTARIIELLSPAPLRKNYRSLRGM